jgi:hypothetical protein
MKPIYINLAVEDDLSEVVIKKLLDESGKFFEILRCDGKRGYGFLKNKIAAFNAASKITPYLVLTDLDKESCAPTLLANWLPGSPDPNLLFRVAVREVEAWLLADRTMFADFFGIAAVNKISVTPDELPDPKKELLRLVGRSPRRALREAVIPRPGYSTLVGPAYNDTLSDFIQRKWRTKEAILYSPSLRKAFEAIKAFRPRRTI